MHEGEVDIDAGLVERLVAGQFPHLADLPITAVPSTGTVNAIYRLGDDLSVRLPRLAAWAKSLTNELAHLPALAPHLTLRVPEPVATGQPTPAYPFTWAIYRWVPGRPYRDDLVDDERRAAADLARFVTELRAVGPSVDGARRAGRRPLAQLDAVTRAAIEASGEVVGVDGVDGVWGVDTGAALAAWHRALEAPAWDGTPVWIHTDLLRPNLLVDGGRLRAVIDFGGVGVGDPAADVVAAWSVFGPAGRAAYRQALDVDDGTWERARGYALHQAALIVPYYAGTNPAFAAQATRTITEVLTDLALTRPPMPPTPPTLRTPGGPTR